MPSARRRAGVAVTLALALLAGGRAFAAEKITAQLDAAARRLDIVADGLEGGGYELRIETRGLRDPEFGADVSEPGIIYLPPRGGAVALRDKVSIPATAENIFFFVDVAADEGWRVVARFGNEVRGTWKLNGRFSELGGDLRPTLVFPIASLEPGENLLHVDGPGAPRPELCLARAVPSGPRFATSVRVDQVDWSGRVLLFKTGAAATPSLVALSEVATPRLPLRRRDVRGRWWEDRTLLADAVLAAGRNILQAQITEPRSFFRGGFQLTYDLERRSYRIPHWIWAWGPAIQLLLELEKLPAAKGAQLDARFRAAALAAGECSLRFEMTRAGHPARGISTVRWEPSRASPTGWVEYLSNADSLFLAGWGWMSCHAATGDSRYLERTKSLVAAAERLMAEYPVVPQDWVVERERWTPHTLDESVFGLAGFRALHDATRAAAVAESGRRYIESHLARMSRGSGLLERAWLRDERRPFWDPDIKGHAWVVEGYLDAYQLTGDEKYLRLAIQLADAVAECQADDGSWTVPFRKPAAGDPIDDKGTAIWAYFFYRMHQATHAEKYRDAARHALGWCLRQQVRSDDPHLDGAIVHVNAMAYVRRRPMTILYTNTFFALALLEELKTAGSAESRGE